MSKDLKLSVVFVFIFAASIAGLASQYLQQKGDQPTSDVVSPHVPLVPPNNNNQKVLPVTFPSASDYIRVDPRQPFTRSIQGYVPVLRYQFSFSSFTWIAIWRDSAPSFAEAVRPADLVTAELAKPGSGHAELILPMSTSPGLYIARAYVDNGDGAFSVQEDRLLHDDDMTPSPTWRFILDRPEVLHGGDF